MGKYDDMGLDWSPVSGFDSDNSKDETFNPEIEVTDEDEEFLEAADKLMSIAEGNNNEAETSANPSRNDPPLTEEFMRRVPNVVEAEIEDDGYHTEELVPLVDSDDENAVRMPAEFQEAVYGSVLLEKEMTFPTLKLFKDAVRDYNIALGRIVSFVKNDKDRCRAICVVKDCDWEIFCSWTETYGSYQVKTYYNQHSCCRELRNPLADSKWVGKKLAEEMYSNPDMTATQAEKYMSTRFQVDLPRMKLYRSMEIARNIVEGSEKEQYALLHDYCNELRNNNPGSTVGVGVQRVDLSEPGRFEKLYVCFHACKRGAQTGCRPLIGLDGCFLKGYYGGQLLTAVTQDGNNAFYVIAYVVVELENKDTWSWFLTRLFEDIGSPQEFGWEFISDMQKGLLPATQELHPGIRHMFCVKHLEQNVWKQWRSTELRLKLWACAKSKTMPEFQKNFRELKVINEAAWLYLTRFNPQCWSRAGFSTESKNQSLLNNMSEQFNAAIVKFRGKPIISMLEDIRLYVMAKMNNSRKKIERYPGPITPTAQNKIELAKKNSHNWHPMWAGDQGKSIFQVQHVHMSEKHVVNLDTKSCSCNEYDLSGIPCEHAVACIWHNGKRPEDFVSAYFSKEMWEMTYRPFIKPVRGKDQWVKTNLDVVVPPHYKKGGGRPKKKSRNKENDVPINPYKAKRVQRPTRCSRCGNNGHNKRNCKGTVQDQNKKKSKKQGRKASEEGSSSRMVTGPSQAETQPSGSSQTRMGTTASGPCQAGEQPSRPSQEPMTTSKKRGRKAAWEGRPSNDFQIGEQASIPNASSFYTGEVAPVLVPTPGMTSASQTVSRPIASTLVQRSWNYGQAPSSGQMLPQLGISANVGGPAVRASPRRPPAPLPRTPPPPTGAGLRPTTAVSTHPSRPPPPLTRAGLLRATTPTSFKPPSQAIPGASSVASRIREHSFSSRGKQVVTAETLQRATRITRSLAASLKLPREDSTSKSTTKVVSKTSQKK